MITILDGNAFYLRITGKTKVGEYEATLDLAAIDSLIVNFVRRVRESQTVTHDQGKVLAYNDGKLAKGVYGVEMVGYYNGQPWRFYAPEVFEIADDGETEASNVIGSVNVYDVTFYMKLGGDGVTPGYVDAAVTMHNTSEEAHTDIREAITGIRTQVERRLVGAKVTFSDGHTEDVELGFNDQGEVILLLPKETFGKIDGVSVNGEELEVDDNGKVDINFSATVDGTYSDTPSVTPTIGEGGIQLDFQGLRGNGIASYTEELSNEDGGVNTHTFVDDAGNEHVVHTRNGRGIIGPQGATAVYDSSQQYPPFEFDTVPGQSDTKGMTQKAITNELRPVKRILSDFSWVNKAMHPATPSTLKDWEGMRTSLAYPVKIGDKVVVDTANNGTNQFTVIVFLTTANQASDWTKKAGNTYTDGQRHLFSWTANADGYVRVCGYTSDMDAYIVVGNALATQEGLDVEKGRITEIEKKIAGGISEWTMNIGVLHPNTGDVQTPDSSHVERGYYRYSNFVTLNKGDKVTVRTYFPETGTYAVIAKSSGPLSIAGASGDVRGTFLVKSYTATQDGESVRICVYVGENADVEWEAKTTLADALVKRSDIESVLEGDGLPDYWLGYLSSKMAGFNAGADTFAFISDTHSAENVGNSGEVLYWLTKNKGVSKVIHGGDVCCTGGPSTSFDNVPTNFEQMLVRDIKAYDRLAERASQYARFFGVKGNHDFFEYSGGAKGVQSNADVARHIKGLMTDFGVRDNMQTDTDSLYYYYDNSIAGIRYIFIDACHNSNTGYIQIGILQLTWLISTLNSTPSNYKVIVIGHSPASTYMAPSDETLQDKIGCVREMLIKANAKASGTYHYYHQSSGIGTEEGDVAYDFSSFNGEVIAYVHGHTHVDNQVYHEGIPFIGIVCDKAGQNPYSPFCEGTEMAVSNKSVGTAKEQAIDVATINSTKDVISMRRVGIGFDRHFHVGVVELEVGQTLTLSPSILTAASYGGADEDSTISNGVWTYKHDYATIDASTGVVTAIAQGDVIVFAEDTDHNKEFFHIKVTE